MVAAFSRAAGYCTEKSEGHRRPWGEAPPARDFAFHIQPAAAQVADCEDGWGMDLRVI